MPPSLALCALLSITLAACSAGAPSTTSTGAVTGSPDAQVPSGSVDAGGEPLTPLPGSPDGSGDPALCERLSAAARPLIPRVLIVADRSNSMTQSTGAASCPPCFESRWDGSVKAMKDVTAALDKEIDFGLMLFPTAGLGSTSAVACVAGELSVKAEGGSSAAIATALDAANPGGATPTAKALSAAKRVLIDDVLGQPDPDLRPSYVLLVTDGEPTCEDKTMGIEEPAATYAALDTLLSAGVPTYVIGYGIGGLIDTSATMDTMAVHGGTGQYYRAESQPELLAALNTIATSVVSCDFALERDPPRGDEFIHVTIDGKDIPASDQGWTREARVIRMRGPACELLRDGGTHKIEIVVECEPVQVF